MGLILVHETAINIYANDHFWEVHGAEKLLRGPFNVLEQTGKETGDV